jgi:hypothetical protein
MNMETLVLPLGVDLSALSKGIDSASDKVGGLVKGIANVGGKIAMAGITAGAAAITGLSAAVLGVMSSTSEWAESLDTIGDKLGIATDAAAGLLLVSQQTGIDAELLSKSMNALSNAVVTNADAFAELGISVANADGSLKDTPALMEEVARALDKLPDGLKKTNLEMKLFGGKIGPKMYDMLKKIANAPGGLKDFNKQARAMGLVLSEDVVLGFEKVGQWLEISKLRFQGISNVLGTALLPPLLRLLDYLTEIANNPKFIEWVNGVAKSVGEFADKVVSKLIILFDFLKKGDVLGALGFLASEFKRIFLEIWDNLSKVEWWKLIQDAWNMINWPLVWDKIKEGFSFVWGLVEEWWKNIDWKEIDKTWDNLVIDADKLWEHAKVHLYEYGWKFSEWIKNDLAGIINNAILGLAGVIVGIPMPKPGEGDTKFDIKNKGLVKPDIDFMPLAITIVGNLQAAIKQVDWTPLIVALQTKTQECIDATKLWYDELKAENPEIFSWLETIGKIAGVIALFVLGGKALTAVLLFLTPIINGLSTAFAIGANLGGFFAVMWAKLVTVVSGGALATAIGGFVLSLKVLASTIFQSFIPTLLAFLATWGIVILGVVAIIWYLYNNWDKFKSDIGLVWEGIKKLFEDGVLGIKIILNKLFGWFSEEANSEASAHVYDFAYAFVNTLLEALRSKWGEVTAWFEDAFKKIGELWAGLFASPDATLTPVLPTPPIIGGRAGGGPMSPGETSWVGEKGPELFTAGKYGGMVTANKNILSSDEAIGLLRKIANREDNTKGLARAVRDGLLAAGLGA